MAHSTLNFTAQTTTRQRSRPSKVPRKRSATLIADPFPFKLDTIQQMNCVEGMGRLPDHSVDLAIADPPYNASKGGEWRWDNSMELPGLGGNWSKVRENWDSMGLTEYLSFTLTWLSELKRVVRPTGSI